MVLTRVHGPVEGDVVFDLGSASRLAREIQSKNMRQEGGNSHAFSIVELEPPQIEQ